MSERSQRVTFRIPPELGRALRRLPNQTAFVEEAIRDALARQCPLCAGKGRVASAELRVPSFRRAQLPKLSGADGRRLQSVVRMGRRICATDLGLDHHRRRGWTFQLARRGEVLVQGALADAGVLVS